MGLGGWGDTSGAISNVQGEYSFVGYFLYRRRLKPRAVWRAEHTKVCSKTEAEGEREGKEDPVTFIVT